MMLYGTLYFCYWRVNLCPNGPKDLEPGIQPVSGFCLARQGEAWGMSGRHEKANPLLPFAGLVCSNLGLGLHKYFYLPELSNKPKEREQEEKEGRKESAALVVSVNRRRR